MTRIMNEIERERERTRMRHPRHPEKGTKRCLTSCAPRCTAFLGETNTHNLMCDSPLAVTLSHCDCPPKTLLEVASSGAMSIFVANSESTNIEQITAKCHDAYTIYRSCRAT